MKHEAIRDKQLEEIQIEIELEQILNLEPPEGGPITYQVNFKAVALMMDKELDKQQLSALPEGAKVDHKAVKIFGESKLMSDKFCRALKILGDKIEPQQVAKMIRADKQFAAQKEKQDEQKRREEIAMVMNKKPERRATEILELCVNQKAIFKMGDRYLEERALGFCPSNMRGNKKATFTLGCTQVAAKKAEYILDRK